MHIKPAGFPALLFPGACFVYYQFLLRGFLVITMGLYETPIRLLNNAFCKLFLFPSSTPWLNPLSKTYWLPSCIQRLRNRASPCWYSDTPATPLLQIKLYQEPFCCLHQARLLLLHGSYFLILPFLQYL